MIDHLNKDLANELAAVAQYTTYAAKANGPYRPQLAHAQLLANKIVALGGEPTTVASPVPPASSNKEMLEAILNAEKKARADYTRRPKEAEEYGDKGLSVWLDDMIADESGHAEETESILEDWPL